MKLRVFLWNDDYETMTHWQNALNKAGFEVVPSWDPTAEKVVEAYRNSATDIVLLDVLHNSTENPIGLLVARRIRKFDLLVPIIAVTTRPEHIYSHEESMQELDLIGIFQDSIMLRHESLRELGIRGPLNLWHEVVPEFALTRGVVRALDRCSGGSASLESLRNLIVSLPMSGGHDVWHPSLCVGLVAILKAEGLEDVAAHYSNIVAIFSKADGFYMAAGWSRKHLSHNVQVFLLGMYFLLVLPPIRVAAVKGMQSLGVKDESAALLHAIIAWACVATTHDTAYLAQDFSKVSSHLTEVANLMRGYVDLTLKELEPVSWPTLHHSVIGARLWSNGLSSGAEPNNLADKMRWLIAQGIARHDTKAITLLDKVAFLKPVTTSPVPLTPETWIQFLAVMADELQDWQRERPEELAKFRTFALDAVQHWHNSPGVASVALRFVARDHSTIIREFQGMDRAVVVEKHLRGLLDRLASYVTADGTIGVELSVSFSSRGSLVRSVDTVF